MRSLVFLSVAMMTAACGGGASRGATTAAPPAAPAADGDRPAVATDFTLGDDGALTLPGPIAFAPSSAELDEVASAPALWLVVDYLAAKSYVTTLRIEGHTDSDSGGEAGLALSGERALTVARWLVHHGVDCKRLLAVGFGDSKPIADDATPEGKAQNRRIAAVNAALRGRAIGGMPIDGGGQVAGDVCE